MKAQTVIFKNKKGIITRHYDKFGNPKYLLCDTKGNRIKNLPVPFLVSDYL